jgi:sugar lactone lactonase YvrE
MSSQQVITVAGTTQGYADGSAIVAAKFSGPNGICIHPNGSYLYIADYSNQRIRHSAIGSAYAVGTTAGSGVAGYADENMGNPLNAQFNNPLALCADNSGNIYVADYSNNVIRKISSGGIVSTVANSAQLSGPTGVAIDPFGNLWIADYGNGMVKKVSNYGSGTITYITSSHFSHPYGITSSPAGNIYVSDAGNHKIIKIPVSSGIPAHYAGVGQGYSDLWALQNAMFNSPAGLAADASENVYVADFNNHKIRKISSAGLVTTLAGANAGFADGLTSTALFNGPAGLALDNSGCLYVADLYNYKIRRLVFPGCTNFCLAQGSHYSVDYNFGWGQSDLGDGQAGSPYESYGCPNYDGKNGYMRINNGSSCSFVTVRDGRQLKISKNISALNNTNWTCDFTFNIDAPPSEAEANNSPAVNLLVVNTNGNGLLTSCTGGNLAVACNPFYQYTQNDAVWLNLDSNAPEACSPAEQEVAAKQWVFRPYAMEGNVSNPTHLASNLTKTIAVIPGLNTYYVRFERVGSDMGQLSVYYDYARTTHIPGSPVCFDIPYTVTSLAALSHGVVTWGSYDRIFSGTISNLKLDNSNPCSLVCRPPAKPLGEENTRTINSDTRIYPNPGSQEVFVKTDLNECQLDVYNILGIKVGTKDLNAGENKLSVLELPSGIYFFKVIKDGSTLETHKILIQK